LRVHVCGVRGSTPTPGADFARVGGHTSCIALARDGALTPTLLLDAGTGIRRVGELLAGGAFHGSILLGHLHWDHTQGLPFFPAGDRPDARVDLYVPAQDGMSPRDLLARSMSPPSFPIGPEQLRGAWRFLPLDDGRFDVEGFEVVAREIPHKGGRTFGFRVSDGRSTIAYLSDHHPFSLGAGPDGFGPYHDAARELCEGVDVLFHDAQYTTEQWTTHRGFGHSTVRYAVGLAEACGVGRLMLYHHDPARTDDAVDELAAVAAASSTVAVEAAVEGTVLHLGASVPA
jgi:phosphoribosyl 1,2-cyclic phosphodiesterase